jgi:hypothetical protein
VWIDTRANGEYLNPAMIERISVRDNIVTAHMPSGDEVVISEHWTTDEGVDALTTLMRMVGSPLQ